MRLSAEEPFEDIRIAAICREAGITLAQFRELFPSKGAVLGALSRMIDREVLIRPASELTQEGAKDRLFDVLMARLDAMAPYKVGLKGVFEWARRDPGAAYNLNVMMLNSMRFMMEAANLDHDGVHGAVKLQGLVALWTRVLTVWFDDDDPGLARTMAELDRLLERGGRVAARLDDLHRLASPLRNFASAIFVAGLRGRRKRPMERYADGDDRDDFRRDVEDDHDVAPRDESAKGSARPKRLRGGWPDEEPPTKFA
ncbi:MAG: TetR/AcrR family transcriptional regulator [Rhodoblastus sp.]|nr:MAG: TetR/AcrR family transcriptional regulator [Rhodoblastus sp.]